LSDLRDQVQASLGNAYTIDRELGGGGMSRVFVVHDSKLRRDLVVKVLPPELVAGVNVERFRREILVAAGLQHPHIVPVIDSGETDGLPWFSMPFVQGETLRERIARGPLPINEIVGILRDVAKALAYAHERGVVHRDIKPDNVLLTGGSAVVTDFGIAKALSMSRSDVNPTETRSSLTQIGTSIGTPMYMAPEQAAADPDTDARADIYSFGCLAYELLAGRPPFAGMSPQRLLAAHMAERPKSVAELRRDTPPLLAELVMRCLEKEPVQRPANATDLIRLLDAATTTSGTSAATSAALLGGRVRLRVALALWAVMFGAVWILAKAAIVGIGLPSWVLPGALIVAVLGLPMIFFTAFVQRTAHDALVRTPTLTPGGSRASQGTMATIAVKAVPHVSWRRTVRGGVLAFSAFIAMIVVFMGLRAAGVGPAGSLLASGRISAKEPLLVTDFSVKSGDSTLAGVVSEAMRASLGQSSTIRLVAPAAVAVTLQQMQRPAGERLTLLLARDVAQREGIRAIVDGDVAALGAGYVVTVRLVTADSGLTLATAQKAVDGPKELIAAIDVMGRDLRAKLGESLRSVQRSPALEQVTTPSIEALRLYSEGARAYDVDADFVTAVSRLHQAIALDSGFAMAWRKLAAVYGAGGFPTSMIDSAATNAYRFRDRLTPRERLITTGSYFMGAGANRPKAAAAYEQLLAQGDSDIGTNNLGLIEQDRRHPARAETLFAAAQRLGLGGTVPYINMTAVQLDARQYADAEKTVATTLQHFPSATARASTKSVEMISLATEGHLDQSEHLADSLAAYSSGAAKSRALFGRVAFVAMYGRPTEAAARMAAMTAFNSSMGLRDVPLADSIALARLDVTLDQPARAVARLDAALAAAPLSSMAPADRDYLSVATIYAQAKRPDKAKAILAERLQEVRDTAKLRNEGPLVHRVIGEIDLAESRPADAVREFWKGDSLPDGPVDDCDVCTFSNVARAYDKANVPDSAIVYFEKYFDSGYYDRLFNTDVFDRAPSARRLGELYEAKGDRAKAAHYYQMFVDLWKNAEPALQPQVADVKRRLARLGDTEKP
jgi:tetratricopeptide (TPR) repeat protein/TolB-like protein